MAKDKKSATKRKPTSASPEKRRQSAPQPQAPHKHSIRYERDTKYGRFVCDYDISAALATDEQGNTIAAIIKAFQDRFDEDLDTSLSHPQFASKIKDRAQKKGITREQVEQELRDEHRASQRSHVGAAWSEFSNGLGIAIENAVHQHFEMSVIVAKIHHKELAPHLKVVENKLIELVRQQIKFRLKYPDLGAPLFMLSWEYYVCLRDWQKAKRIYRQNRDSTSWRKQIKDEYPGLPDDLIEWLALSDDRSSLAAEAFQKLPSGALGRLKKRMEREDYWLSKPSDIALEHAARLCGSRPYDHSKSRLNNIKSQHKEDAEKMGVRYYLKNTKSRNS